ncbi:MAG: hypothetical protein KC416_03185 [Myxococcales bacterium]|nr:hypothetical protein [Myxococcales bacterium]
MKGANFTAPKLLGDTSPRLLLSWIPTILLTGLGSILSVVLLWDAAHIVEPHRVWPTVTHGAPWLVSVCVGLFAMDIWKRHEGHSTRVGFHRALIDVGQGAVEGLGLESGIARAAERATGTVRRLLRRTLLLARDRPLPAAVLQAGTEAGGPDTLEGSRFLAEAIETGGDAGSRLRMMGDQLARTESAERSMVASLGFGLLLLRLLGLGIVPPLFAALSNATGYQPWPDAFVFFSLVAFLIAAVEARVVRSLLRIPARLPLYLCWTQLALLFLWRNP